MLANKGDFIKESESNTVDRYGLSVSYNDEIIREHKIHLNEILCHYCFLGGHYTKVIDLEDIDTGLKVLDFMDMFYKLQKQLIKAGFQDRDELLRFEQYMKEPYHHISGPRAGYLSFYYPVSNGNACKHYTRAVGGEIIEFGQDLFPNIYNYFCSIGIPLKIIAKIPFNRVEGFFAENLIDNVIRVVLQHELDDITDISWMDYEIRTSSNITRDQFCIVYELDRTKELIQ